MATNNFKKLAEEADKQFPHAPPEIENQIMGKMRMTHFVGNVVDLYLPRLFDMILALFGGGSRVEKPREDTPIRRDSDESDGGHSKTDL